VPGKPVVQKPEPELVAKVKENPVNLKTTKLPEVKGGVPSFRSTRVAKIEGFIQTPDPKLPSPRNPSKEKPFKQLRVR
jgi:hypothetical protein